MNRLAGSTSPYLRQHADNPVDWWPWIPEAFAEAKRRNVPVHLSIGYAACHWCHVMARESFSDPATAEHLNRDFVSIKVDREERPEVDQIYMRALHALGEQGGWPLTMFLTPDAEPFWGGTYFPPEPHYGRPSFRQVLGAISAAWTSQDAAVTKNAAALHDHLNRPVAPPTEAPSPTFLDEAARTILSVWDMSGGSFKGAPKFPNPVVLDLLWRAYRRTGDSQFRDAVTVTLTHLCQGGIYDHVGGGFARYSVDAEWLVPHFEKMLYDNGLLLSALAYAQHEAPRPLFRQRIDETVAWLVREMQLPGGGFAASLDADTEHEEGLTYVWSVDELREALGDDFATFAEIYDASPGGNWEGKIILNRLRRGANEWLGDDKEAALAKLRAILLSRRNKRPQPTRDDKVLADWNGLAIAGLAHAARVNGNEAARDAALSAFRFVSESMSDGDRLAHSTLDGESVFPGVATDYANMIRAALALFALEGDAVYLDPLRGLVRRRAPSPFRRGSRRLQSRRGRRAGIDRNAVVAHRRGDAGRDRNDGIERRDALHADRRRAHIASTPSASSRTSRQMPRAMSSGLQACNRRSTRCSAAGWLSSTGEGALADALLQAALAEADPALFVASAAPDDLPAGHPAHGKRPTKDEAALFLCDATSCLPEITSNDEAAEALASTRRGLA